MNQTHPVGATTHHTEQTLKNRYQEALDILKALEDREAVSGGSTLAAVLVEKSEALDWVERTAGDLHEYRAAHRERAVAGGWIRLRDRPGVVGRGNRC